MAGWHFALLSIPRGSAWPSLSWLASFFLLFISVAAYLPSNERREGCISASSQLRQKIPFDIMGQVSEGKGGTSHGDLNTRLLWAGWLSTRTPFFIIHSL